MPKTLCKVIGLALLVVGAAGFVAPHLLGMHLTLVHNVIHVATGVLALYFGFAGSASAARTFALVFGSVYLLLGVLGFVAPALVATVLGHPPVSAGELMPDNAVHLVLGAVLLVAALTSRTSVTRAAA